MKPVAQGPNAALRGDEMSHHRDLFGEEPLPTANNH